MGTTARNIPNTLRRYRKLWGYEQMDVAYILGLKSHALISKWECGVMLPNIKNLMQLCIIYRTVPDELYYDLRHRYQKDITDRQEKLAEKRRDEGG